MKKFLIATGLIGLLACAAAWAQPNDEWNGKPRVFGVNVLNPHVTSMPYTTVEEAVQLRCVRLERDSGPEFLAAARL